MRLVLATVFVVALGAWPDAQSLPLQETSGAIRIEGQLTVVPAQGNAPAARIEGQLRVDSAQLRIYGASPEMQSLFDVLTARGASLSGDLQINPAGMSLRNATVSFDGVVIQADEITIVNGEIRLGSNARVQVRDR